MAHTENLSEYQQLATDLPFIQPFKGCCSTPLVETVSVEPLAGRDPSKINRTCVVQCPECGRLYLSTWE